MTIPATEGIGGTPAADPPNNEGHGTAADEGADAFAERPLSPLIEEPSRAGKRGRPRGSRNAKRKLKPREKRERKAKTTKAAAVLDTELATAAAVAGADAAKDQKPSAPSVSDSAPVRSTARAVELAAPPVLTDDDMVQIIGLGAMGLARIVPERFSGGLLTIDERELLGRAWWAYLRPFMTGEGGPLAIAIGATVQVFALRWATAAMRAQEAQDTRKASNVAPVASNDAPAAPRPDQVSGKPKSGARGAPQARGLQAPAETIGRPPVAPDPS